MKLLRSHLSWLLCFLLYPAAATGQAYNYAHYTTRDGLAGGTLYDIIQDSDGLMWFGTETGLSRFDGKQFRTFTVADGLPSNEVFGFYEDSRKRLWINSFSNEPCYYYKGRIHNKANTQALRGLVLTAHVHAIAESRQGDIIFIDENHVAAVLEKSGTVRRYDARRFSIDLRDVLYAGGLYVYMLKLPQPIRDSMMRWRAQDVYHSNNATVQEGTVLLEIDNHAQGGRPAWLWCGAGTAPRRITGPERIEFMPFEGHRMLESYRTGGAAILDLKSGRKMALFLPQFLINGIYQDKDRNLWFSTKWNGLYKLSNREITNLTFDAGNASPAVRFVHADSSGVYAGTDNGSFWKVRPMFAARDGMRPGLKKQKLNETVSWLRRHASGRCISYGGADFLQLKYKGSSQGVKTLCLSGDTLLVAASECVYTCPLSRLSSQQRLYEGRATCAVRHEGYYYIGTLHGICLYDSARHPVANLLRCQISHFASGADGLLWVSTLDSGIYALRGREVVARIGTRNGQLSSDLCRCIYYKDGILWVGTDRGVNKVGVRGSRCRVEAVYTLSNGLNADIINSVFAAGGLVYAGTSAGLNIFSDQLAIRDAAFNLCFTQITAGGALADLDQPVVLPHADNSIRFDFSGISFSASKVSYQYRLLGLNGQWQPATEQTLNFLSLPSGKYRLQVRAVSLEGRKSLLIEKAFEVRQSVLEYWWVRSLAALLAAALLFFLVYLRIRTVRRAETAKRETERRMLELEQMALRAQMNPHFIFNCLNSVQHYILKGDAAGANFYLSQFAGLVRQTLENASKPLITLQEEITYLRHYIELERLQVNFPFDYEFAAAPGLVASGMLVPNMIIQPFIENALKHGLSRQAEGGRLSIAIRREASLLRWTITDNGPGIDQTKRAGRTSHQSKGISLIEERIATLNTMRPELPRIRFQIQDLGTTGGRGTTVVVEVPVIPNPSANS